MGVQNFVQIVEAEVCVADKAGNGGLVRIGGGAGGSGGDELGLADGFEAFRSFLAIGGAAFHEDRLDHVVAVFGVRPELFEVVA